MHPIIATGIASVGSKIVQNVVGNIANAATNALQGGPSFDQHLKEAGKTQPSSLQSFLESRNVKSFDDLSRLSQNLTQELRNHPELASKLQKLGSDAKLSLKIEDGNMLSIEGPNGTLLKLDRDSELGQLAYKLHQVKSMETQHAELPGASLKDTTSSVLNQPIQAAQWSLKSPFQA